MSDRLRVSAVSYLNTAPLVWGLTHGPQRGLFDLRFSLPSECADALRAGEADIGLVPTIARHCFTESSPRLADRWHFIVASLVLGHVHRIRTCSRS